MSARVPMEMVRAALAATDFADNARSRAWMRKALDAAFTAAGYRLLAPGELDKETMEKCVAAVNSDKAIQGLARARMVVVIRSLGGGE